MAQQPPFFSRWRPHLVQELNGDVLEIGAGEGENFPYYRRAAQVIAVEPDPERVQLAREAAATASVPIRVEPGVAESLPYADGSFDHVVSSLVFCSVDDPRQALNEIRRVLKPGGALHMFEHVRPQTAVLAWLAAALTPWWSRVVPKCHLDRPTVDVLAQAGWRIELHYRRAIFVRLTAR
jgi:ubiquinone/menaquinone biosynthesis C-methylase UbiE